MKTTGPIAWMTKNSVAANLLMVGLLLGGMVFVKQVKQEVFPEFELDMIVVAVPYPGASPLEVETGILLAVEEAVRGLEGVKRVSSTAKEGMGSARIELLLGSNPQKMVSDVRNAVDQIVSFPADSERPTVQLIAPRKEVISLALYGDISEATLRNTAEEIRTDLQNFSNITQVDVDGVRRPEISIEVSRNTLRAHDLTLQGIAQVVRNSAVELPAGGLKTPEGEVLLRTNERKDLGQEYEDIAIVSGKDGVELKLGNIAQILDGYEDVDRESWYNGKQAAIIKVFRVGAQTPLDIAETVKAYVASASQDLPKGLSMDIWQDRSHIYAQRIDLLLRNAALGLILVLLILGAFLEVRLAFWVTLGIPISFLGSILLMPLIGVSINMISLFGFIVTLGMVVDDAIIVGEAIFQRRQNGEGLLEAAINGAHEVARPVTFSIMTTMVAFSPMFFVPGVSGKFFMVIPAIVVSVLFISLIESLFVLPAHLAHTPKASQDGFWGKLNRGQQRISHGLTLFIEKIYSPILDKALRWKSLTVVICLSMFVLAIGYWSSGRVNFTFMPKVEFDRVTAKATMPFGVSPDETRKLMKELIQTANDVLEENGEPDVTTGTYAQIGSNTVGNGPGAGQAGFLGGHVTSVTIKFVDSGERELGVQEFVEKWREKMGRPASLENLNFRYSMGPGAGPDITLQLNHSDMETLKKAGKDLAEQLAEYPGVKDISDGFSPGKRQLDFKLTEAGRSVGLTAAELGRHLRSSYFGSQVLRQARGRDEMRVYVRLPKEERNSLTSLDSFVIPIQGGGEIPLQEAAQAKAGRSYVEVNRADGNRIITVEANIDRMKGNARKVLGELEESYLPKLLDRYKGLSYSKEGSNRSESESLRSLGLGYIFALFGIFALLAIPFSSYIQPLVVMGAIPFGVVGALLGHVLLGYDMSLISLMGIVALSGVVVNDSLVLVDTANRYRNQGMTALEAAFDAGKRRFRPILLTSLTTFFGLAPMIFETSVQARFLIPMAISLGFGILFATFIILILVPVMYVMAENLRDMYRGHSETPLSEDMEPELSVTS